MKFCRIPKFGNQTLAKFMNHIMRDGKKSVAERIVYGALDRVQERTGKDPVEAFEKALEAIAPMVEVKSRRVGGATYQVPVEVRPARREGARHALARGRRPRARREVHGPAPRRRDRRRFRQPRQRGQEARGHAPHGGREPRLLALPVLIDPAGRRAARPECRSPPRAAATRLAVFVHRMPAR